MTQRVVNYTYGTGNPVLPDGSIDVRDGIDNLQSLDILMNAPEDTYNQRDGEIVQTVAGAIRSIGIPIIGNFTDGCTVTKSSEGVQVIGGSVYRWSGALPKVVAPGSSPSTTGGISPSGDWVDVGDASVYSRIKTELSAPLGVKLVGNAKIYTNSISSMIMLNLSIGDVVSLGCFHFILDGSNHERVIEATDNGSGVLLTNGLWANIPLGTGEVDISWMGAKRQVGYDSLGIIHKALATFKTAKFSGHYYISSGVQMDNSYSLRGENIDTSILEMTTATGAANEGIICYDKPVVVGQNPSCLFTNLSCMTLLSNVNQANWETNGVGMVHSGIYGGIGSGAAGGVAQSAIRDIKIIGCNYVTDIKEGYLNAIDNVRGEKCHHGISITKGTSYSIGILSVVLVKNFCFKLDNLGYTPIGALVADFCEVSQFLQSSFSDLSIQSVGIEQLTGVVNIYALFQSRVVINVATYIGVTSLDSLGAFYKLENGSYLNSLTEITMNDGWGMPSYVVTQSDLILGNILNISRQFYDNQYIYTSYDLDMLIGFRSYGRLFQFSGNGLPSVGNWMIDFVSTTNDVGASGKGSFQVATSITDGSIMRRRFDGVAWTAWA